MAASTLGCHQSGQDKPAACAGFILRGATHNLVIMLAVIRGDLDTAQVTNGGHALHASYWAMVVAKGVPPQANCPRLCRP